MRLTHKNTPLAAPRLFTVPEACLELRVSRWMVNRLIQAHEIRTITIGRRRLISSDAIAAFIHERESETHR